jgi:hypothetical protein
LGHYVIKAFLPLTIIDENHYGREDMLTYISTYRLRKSFEFLGLLTDRPLHRNDVYPIGNHVMVKAPVLLLIEHFPFLTANQIISMGKDHQVEFVQGACKEVHQRSLLSHTCTEHCTHSHFVFKRLSRGRADAAKPKFPSTVDLNSHPHAFIEVQRLNQQRHCTL